VHPLDLAELQHKTQPQNCDTLHQLGSVTILWARKYGKISGLKPILNSQYIYIKQSEKDRYLTVLLFYDSLSLLTTAATSGLWVQIRLWIHPN
jgi:hypothetical protein